LINLGYQYWLIYLFSIFIIFPLFITFNCMCSFPCHLPWTSLAIFVPGLVTWPLATRVSTLWSMARQLWWWVAGFVVLASPCPPSPAGLLFVVCINFQWGAIGRGAGPSYLPSMSPPSQTFPGSSFLLAIHPNEQLPCEGPGQVCFWGVVWASPHVVFAFSVPLAVA